MTSPRTAFTLSILLHGAAVGAVCAFGLSAAATKSTFVAVEILPSEDAATIVDSPPPTEVVEVEHVEQQPPLAEPVEPQDETPPADAEFVAEAPRDDLELRPAPWPSEVLPAWLTAVRARPTPVVEEPPMEVPAQVQPQAPAALVLEVIPGQNPPPPYPWLARRRGWQGVVAVYVLVDAEGSVTKLALARSSGHGVLDDAAIAAVRGWRFRGGPGETTVEVEFVLRAE